MNKLTLAWKGNSLKNVELDSPKAPSVLLDAMETQGWHFPQGCRAGSCGSCRATILSGHHLLEDIGPMEKDTLSRCGDKENIRLSCRAKIRPGAAGTIEFEVAPPLPEPPPDADDIGE